MVENQRRAPAEEKDIEAINPKNDIRVRIKGTVISKQENSVNLDDGTGTVEVFLEEDDLEEVEENQKVRVFGRVLPTPESFEIQGEILQDFEEVDQEIYDRVKKVVNTTQ